MDKFELLKKLRELDEVSLLELLEITSEELVDRFMDKIEDCLPKLYDKALED